MDDSTSQDQQPSLATRSVRGGAWLYGRNIVTSLINLGVMAILARQLTPTDFGLVALATVLLRFAVILAEGGISEYIISDNQEGRDGRVHAAFWMNLMLSTGIVLLGFLALPWIARFYDEPGLSLIIILLGVRYLFSQITIAPYALIKRALGFNKIVKIDSAIEITVSLASVIMALSGWGVLSLVIPGVVLEPLRAIWFMVAAHWAPRLPLRVSEWKGIFRYSSKVIVGSLATTIGAEGDTLVIGKTLGSQSLGLYNMAWVSANMVHRNLIAPISSIALPAYSTLATNADRMKSAFHKMVRLLSVASFPLLVGLFVVADLFILTIYGPQWTLSITPLRILIIYALRYSIGSPANTVFLAVRRPDIPMKFGLAFIPVYLISILVGSAYGIIGVAIGVTFARTLFGVIQLGVSARLASSRPSEVLNQISPAFLASMSMGVIVALARGVLAPFEMRNIFELIILVGLGGVVYLALLMFVFRRLLDDLISMVDAFSPRLGASTRRLLFYRA